MVGLREAQTILSRIQVSLARFFIGSMYVLVGFGFVLASLCVLAFRPGGMREAIRRPTGDGVLDHSIQVFLPFKPISDLSPWDQVPDSKVLGV